MLAGEVIFLIRCRFVAGVRACWCPPPPPPSGGCLRGRVPSQRSFPLTPIALLANFSFIFIIVITEGRNVLKIISKELLI